MNNNILLCGNPNVGKSSLFNALTHSHEHTGNWTGKTVELAKKKIKKSKYTMIDLPGIYSLSSLSDEEKITKNTLLFDEVYTIVGSVALNGFTDTSNPSVCPATTSTTFAL